MLASKQQRTAVLHLQAESDALDAYFLVTKLKEACELLSHQAVVKSSYDLHVLEGLLPLINSQLLIDQPVIGIFLERFDWVAVFEMYREHLATPYQLATYSFNLAKLEYARGNLGEVIVALQKANYKDVLLNLEDLAAME